MINSAFENALAFAVSNLTISQLLIIGFPFLLFHLLIVLFSFHRLYLTQLFIGKPEVVPDLVDHRVLDYLFNVLGRRGNTLYRALIDYYPVRQHVAVIPSPLRERHSLVEA